MKTLINPLNPPSLAPENLLTPTSQWAPGIQLSLAPEWFKDVTLTWEFPVEWVGAVFNVYRSSTPHGGFEKLNTIPLSSPAYIDFSTRQDSKHDLDYYIVQAVVPTLGTFQSYPVSLGQIRLPLPELRAKEVMRREWLLLRKFVGVEVLYFKKKNHGERCNTCWSEKHQKILRPNCVDCLGTSFQLGYYEPIKTLVQFEPDNDDVTATEDGELEVKEDASCWTVPVLNIQPHDVILKLSEFRAYRVELTQSTQLMTAPVRQILRLQELAHDNPTYKLFQREGLVP